MCSARVLTTSILFVSLICGLAHETDQVTIEVPVSLLQVAASSPSDPGAGLAKQEAIARQWWERDSSKVFAHRDMGGYLGGEGTVEADWMRHFLTKYNWQDKSVLDYGIGGGFLGKFLFSQYKLGKYVGVDISQKSLDAAKTNLASQMADGKVQLALTPQAFKQYTPDILVCQAVIQHFPSVTYLDDFLKNVNDSGAADVMLQVRYGPQTSASAKGYFDHESLSDVGQLLHTNSEYLSARLPAYNLVWTDGPDKQRSYLFTGWSRKASGVSKEATNMLQSDPPAKAHSEIQVAVSHERQQRWTDRDNMKATKMDQAALPAESKHINKKTITADWHAEYPTEGPPAAPAKDSCVAVVGMSSAVVISAFLALLS